MTIPELSRLYKAYRGIDWEDWEWDNAQLEVCPYLSDVIILRLSRELLYVDLVEKKIIVSEEVCSE